MGKGSDEQDQAAAAQGRVMNKFADIMGQQYKEGAPWRSQAGGEFTKMISDPSKAMAPGLNELNRATAQQMQGVDQMNPGGLRDKLQRDLKMNLTTSRAQMLNQGYTGAVGALGQLGGGNIQSALGAGQGASSGAANLSQIGAQKKAQSGMGALGSGFGMLLGGI